MVMKKIKKRMQFIAYASCMLITAAILFWGAAKTQHITEETATGTGGEPVAVQTIGPPPYESFGILKANAAELSNNVAGAISQIMPATTDVVTTATTTVVTTTTYQVPVYGISKTEAMNGSVEDREKYIWDFFAEKGYDEVAISGILGNMLVEDPTLTGSNRSVGMNDGTFTDGIIQWDPFSKHQSWANNHGYDWYDLEGQLEHVHEMILGDDWAENRVSSIAGYEYQNSGIIYKYMDGTEFPSECGNVAQATVAFERGIEGSCSWSRDRCNSRILLAYEIYDKLSGRV